MAKTKTKDLFSNIAYAAVTMSALNTLTFSEINTGVSVHEKIAWIISRISWYPSQASIEACSASQDFLLMSLVSNNKVDDIADLSDPAVIDHMRIFPIPTGAAANLLMMTMPFTRDFSDLPGGGLIITPKPLYVAAESIGLAIVGVVACRIYYTVRELTTDEFWDVVQAGRIVE